MNIFLFNCDAYSIESECGLASQGYENLGSYHFGCCVPYKHVDNDYHFFSFSFVSCSSG